MALRLIEAYIPKVTWSDIQPALEGKPLLGCWHERLSDETLSLRLLLTSEDSGALLDLMEQRFSYLEGFRMMVLPVEAYIPRPPAPDAKPPESPGEIVETIQEPAPVKVSREELYTDVEETAKPSRTYLLMVALSSVVAGIGIYRNNTAIIIGAMVIAPLLGPNVALALATTLADGPLARRALKALGEGIAIALSISVAWGLAVHVDPGMSGMLERIQVGPGDIVLALASGCAAVLSVTAGASGALVGVMVAVALLPPLVTTGLMLGSGQWVGAQGALLVFLTNVISINLAGILTFLMKGVQPLTWWEAKKAKRASHIAIGLWVLLLAALASAIALASR